MANKMSKKRRHDAGVATDVEVVDYLDRNPNLYKTIQLGCYLEKYPQVDYISYNGDPEELIVNVYHHFVNIFLKFFPDTVFHNGNGENEIFIRHTDRALFFEMQIEFNDPSTTTYLSILEDQYNKYAKDVVEYLNRKFNVNIHTQSFEIDFRECWVNPMIYYK